MANWPTYSRGNNNNQNLQLWLSVLQNAGNTISKLGQQWHQDSAANKAMNTQLPPRAALVDAGTNPQTGEANTIPAEVPTSGSAPFTGGKAGMDTYLQMHNADLKNQQNQMNQQYKLMQMDQMGNRQGNAEERINIARERLGLEQDKYNQGQTNKQGQIPAAAQKDLMEINAANQFTNANLGTDIETAQKYAQKWVPNPSDNGATMINPELSAKVGRTLTIPKSAIDTYGPVIYKANGTYQYYKQHQPDLLNQSINDAYGPKTQVNPQTQQSDQQFLQNNPPNVAGQTGKYSSQLSGNDVVKSILPQANQSTPQSPVPQQ